jgi:hypothetical protein
MAFIGQYWTITMMTLTAVIVSRSKTDLNEFQPKVNVTGMSCRYQFDA